MEIGGSARPRTALSRAEHSGVGGRRESSFGAFAPHRGELAEHPFAKGADLWLVTFVLGINEPVAGPFHDGEREELHQPA